MHCKMMGVQVKYKQFKVIKSVELLQVSLAPVTKLAAARDTLSPCCP